MLDIHTLDKEIAWLYARHDQQDSQQGKDIIRSLLDEVIERRNNISKKIQEEGPFGKLILSGQKGNITTYVCQTCGGKHNIIKTYFSIRFIDILRKTFEYCVENQTHTVFVKDIKTLTHSDYCNFAVLQRFGFIYAIKDGKQRGEWGVAVKRIYAFLRGEWKCAEYSMRNVLTKVRVVSDERVSIYEIYEKENKKLVSLDHDDLESLPHYIKYTTIEDIFPDNSETIGE